MQNNTINQNLLKFNENEENSTDSEEMNDKNSDNEFAKKIQGKKFSGTLSTNGSDANTHKNENDFIIIRYKINPKSNYVKIFGTDFVLNNKDKCSIQFGDKISQLSDYFYIDKKYMDNNEFLEIKLIGISDITDLSYMFSNCTSLISLIDASNWDVSKCTKMSYMFNNCKLLKTLPDLSNWNTSNVIYMDSLFKCCKSLIILPDISKWDTSKTVDMSFMFCNCESLLTLPDISKWDVSKVTNMEGIFMYCMSLITTPDISKWNKSENNLDMSNMFYNCSSLLKIDNNLASEDKNKKLICSTNV